MATSPEDRVAAVRVCEAVRALNKALLDAARTGLHVELARNDKPALGFQQFVVTVLERRERISL